MTCPLCNEPHHGQDTGFTPGPWELRMLPNGWGIFPTNAPKKWSLEDVICGSEADYDPLWDKEPDEANARLIAAAPCMAAFVQKHADAGDAEAIALWERINANS